MNLVSRRRLAVGLAVLCTVGALAACGSGRDSDAARGTSSRTPSERVQPATNGSQGAESSSGFTGIIVLSCEVGDQSFTLDAYDPRTGAQRNERTFEFPTGWRPSYSCPVPAIVDGTTATPWRQLFDRTFDRIALTMENDADRSSHVGYMSFAASEVTDVTEEFADDGDFASAPQDVSPGFDDKTGDFAYEANDPESPNGKSDGQIFFVNDVSRRPSNISPGSDGFYMSNGQPIPHSAGEASVLADPSGHHLLRGGPYEITVWKPGGDDYDAPQADVGAACFLSSWVDDHRVLCVGSGADRGVIRIATLDDDFRGGRTKDLIPESDRANEWPVASPDRSQVAFTSNQGDSTSLFVQSLDGTGTPRKLADLGENTMVLAWTE